MKQINYDESNLSIRKRTEDLRKRVIEEYNKMEEC